jgi:hypothetical protein
MCAEVYASYADGSSGASGNVQGVCPPGWLLPIIANYATLSTQIGNAATVCAALRPLNSCCAPILDTYGFANKFGLLNGVQSCIGSHWYTNDQNREDGFTVDDNYATHNCDLVLLINEAECEPYGCHVRCFRQL